MKCEGTINNLGGIMKDHKNEGQKHGQEQQHASHQSQEQQKQEQKRQEELRSSQSKDQKSSQQRSSNQKQEGQEQDQESLKRNQETNKRNAQMASHLTPEQIESAESQEGEDTEMKGVSHTDYLQRYPQAQQKNMPAQGQPLPATQGNKGQGGYKGLDFAKLEQIDQRLESDEEFARKFEESPEETLKNEGFNLPQGMKIRHDGSYKSNRKSSKHASTAGENIGPSRFEVRIGHIVISE